MSPDVFEETPREVGAEFVSDPFDIGPEVSFVVFTFALSCLAERLAWVSGNEGVDCAGEWSGVECRDVIPDWGRGEVSGLLGCDKLFPWVWFPFDIATGVEAGFCEHKAHIKATGSAAQAKPVSGTWHHVIHCPRRVRGEFEPTGAGRREWHS